MVSIIVPVYNTEGYLAQCIESLIAQTYGDLEIIFVDDGSTDSSPDILRKYQEKDNRIQMITKKNEGQGIARNVGIQKAKGEWIMFVDSDDYITPDCVERLYNSAKEHHADIAVGDIAKTVLNSEQIDFTLVQNIDTYIDKNNKKEMLFRILTFPVAKLLRKALFTDNGLLFPDHFFEDAAVLPVVYAMADTICYEKKIVYIYRNQENSTVHNVKFIYDRIKCVKTVLEEFKRLGIYDEYKEELRDFAIERSRINRRKVKDFGIEIYNEFEKRQFEFDFHEFGIIYKKNPQVVVFGSYNLMIAAKIFLQIPDKESVPNYYGFQNIISATDNPNTELLERDMTAGNKFRNVMLKQDFLKSFTRSLEQILKNADLFILDFLEERLDTGRFGGKYFTLSPGFYDVEHQLDIEYERIPAFQEEWRILWFERCERFINMLKQNINEAKIILVKSKLAEESAREGVRQIFPDIENIKWINEQLERCYAYFTKRCPQAAVIEVEKMEFYYTDFYYRHGCVPWHLNNKAYKEIASAIKNRFGEKILW